MTNRFLWAMPFAGIAVLLSGCVTAVTQQYIGDGVDRNFVYMKAVQSRGKLYFEVMEKPYFKERSQQTFTSWAQLDRDKNFAKGTNITWDFKYSEGPIPRDVLDGATAEDSCISTKMNGNRLELHDSCNGQNRKTLIQYNWTRKFGHPWRLALDPVVIPVAFAVDLALSPIYLAYGVKCATVGCPK